MHVVLLCAPLLSMDRITTPTSLPSRLKRNIARAVKHRQQSNFRQMRYSRRVWLAASVCLHSSTHSARAFPVEAGDAQGSSEINGSCLLRLPWGSGVAGQGATAPRTEGAKDMRSSAHVVRACSAKARYATDMPRDMRRIALNV